MANPPLALNNFTAREIHHTPIKYIYFAQGLSLKNVLFFVMLHTF